MNAFLETFFVFSSLFAAGAAVSLIARFALRTDSAQGELSRSPAKFLPGYDCAMCGFDECDQFAHAVMNGEAMPENCVALGSHSLKMIHTASEMSDIRDVPRKKAVVLCCGTKSKAKTAFHYSGLGRCRALFHIAEGDKVCKSACLGLGDCVLACTEDAIFIDDGLASVIPERCSGCGKCVPSCPKGIIRMISAEADYYVACSSHDSAEFKANACQAACTACGICEKKGAGGGFFIHSALAEIEYTLHGERGEAFASCPSKVIKPYKNGKKPGKIFSE